MTSISSSPMDKKGIIRCFDHGLEAAKRQSNSAANPKRYATSLQISPPEAPLNPQVLDGIMRAQRIGMNAANFSVSGIFPGNISWKYQFYDLEWADELGTSSRPARSQQESSQLEIQHIPSSPIPIKRREPTDGFQTPKHKRAKPILKTPASERRLAAIKRELEGTPKVPPTTPSKPARDDDFLDPDYDYGSGLSTPPRTQPKSSLYPFADGEQEDRGRSHIFSPSRNSSRGSSGGDTQLPRPSKGKARAYDSDEDDDDEVRRSPYMLSNGS